MNVCEIQGGCCASALANLPVCPLRSRWCGCCTAALLGRAQRARGSAGKLRWHTPAQAAPCAPQVAQDTHGACWKPCVLKAWTNSGQPGCFWPSLTKPPGSPLPEKVAIPLARAPWPLRAASLVSECHCQDDIHVPVGHCPARLSSGTCLAWCPQALSGFGGLLPGFNGIFSGFNVVLTGFL